MREKIWEIEEKLSKVSDEIVSAQVEIRRGYEAQVRLPQLKIERDKLIGELRECEMQILTGTIVNRTV